MSNKINLKVLAEAGTFADLFNMNQTVGHVVKAALSFFGIDSKLYSQYELMLEDTPLNNLAKMDELGIVDHTQLLLHNKGPTVDGGI